MIQVILFIIKLLGRQPLDNIVPLKTERRMSPHVRSKFDVAQSFNSNAQMALEDHEPLQGIKIE